MSHTDGTDETDRTDDYQDDAGLAGMAVGLTRVDGTETPGIVRGTEDIEVGDETLTTRVLVDAEGNEQLINTDADRVEVI
jgi:hypothetical protein